ncbi:hypothetical protein F5Y05DRAFT_140489 [Hypoxylon sp. FL0543]|nr:hypothetical protein F5Y05DRAFT_140489 [Hypoxylon sp. FL0543]
MDSQPFAEAPEADPAPSPRYRGPRFSTLDAAIKQLLKEHPSEADSSYNSEWRERRDLTRLQDVELECDSGDTLVIVNFPEGHVDCRMREWSRKRFLVHSEKLLSTHSKVFADLLSPERQKRLRRRIEIEYPGQYFPQEFVIDLTPSCEGDELAAHLMELSVPSGVRDWWMSKERLGISPYLVSGHDDYCLRHFEVPIDCEKVDTYAEDNLARGTALPNIDLADVHKSTARAIEEYCPIRHRANIIRLILAIEGHDIILNSAARVFTLTGVANILDCTDVVRDSVCTWLMAEPNTEFIDINTEAALRIAWTLKLVNVTRAAFRILVVERAFDTLSPRSPLNGNRRTVFGRFREDLPDELQTAVQYSARLLEDRIQQRLARLRSDQFYDEFEIEEYQKLTRVGDLVIAALAKIPPPSTKKSASEADIERYTQLNELFGLFTVLKKNLLEFKDWMVREALNATPNESQQNDLDRDRRCYVPRTEFTPLGLIHRELSDAQRLLTPLFWEELASCPLSFHKKGHPDRSVEPLVDKFNATINQTIQYLQPDGESKAHPSSLHFNLDEFRSQLSVALSSLWSSWTRPALEAPLTRTKHMVLALSNDEFKYLPLWAGGLDDGTGGVFDTGVPDAESGPNGPGPAYHTGDTVASVVSSICQSEKTPSQASTATLTAGRSLAAAHSNAVPSTARDGASVARTMSSSIVMVDAADALDDEDEEEEEDEDDAFGFDDSDEISDDAWSQVEAPY